MLNTLEYDAAKLTVELEEKDRLLEEKEAEIERLRHRIRLLEKALFGPRSERVVDVNDKQPEFDELLAELLNLSDELERQNRELEEAAKQKKTPQRRKKRRSLEDLIPDDLPREEIVMDIPEEDRVCLETGKPLVRIGEERTEKLAYKPGCYFLKVFIRPKYASAADSSQGVQCYPIPRAAIPGGHYDESFLAGIAVDKCAYHLPLYRQEERLRHNGLEISRQTLCRLYMQVAIVLEPIYTLMKEIILNSGVLFTDDTPVKLLVKGQRKTVTGRMWVYIGGGTGPPYRIFEFTRDRCKHRPAEFLAGFQGYIHADAYGGYDNLFAQECIVECACWMHVRRKFVEAMDVPPPLRSWVLSTIRRIYRYERFLRDKSDEAVLAVRQQKISPLIDELFKRTADANNNGEILPESAFAKAIGYMHRLGDALKTFLTDPRLKPDNGMSERALRPLTIGRKNWLFAGSKSGGQATGILLSIIQSCRVLDIDPFEYLDDVLRRINNTPRTELENLLPHQWKPAIDHYIPKPQPASEIAAVA